MYQLYFLFGECYIFGSTIGTCMVAYMIYDIIVHIHSVLCDILIHNILLLYLYGYIYNIEYDLNVLIEMLQYTIRLQRL
jgi:hypothetical protein